MALGFGADCIKIVVSMATDRSHRLTMGKTKKFFFSEADLKKCWFAVLLPTQKNWPYPKKFMAMLGIFFFLSKNLKIQYLVNI